VAATSCEHGIILLDEKYAAAGQTLNLRATLAHELTHHRQHQERKARFGESYCASPRYEADKPRFEADADAVGDKVAALFLRGRGVEIVNACDAVVSIYLEADNPVAVRGAEAAFQRIPARSAALSPERALSGRFRFHARTAPDAGKIHVWENKTSAETRIIEGRTARLRSIRLSAPDRLDAPFRLRLACPGGAR
jgi:ribosomal protein L35